MRESNVKFLHCAFPYLQPLTAIPNAMRSPKPLAALLCGLALSLGCAVAGHAATAFDAEAKPLVIGETLTLRSVALGETRRVNVYQPAGFAAHPSARVPVLYMPDGGLAEDFLHVAGLLQVSFANGTMRPFLLVGIENTERRRDLTGPTEDPKDRAIAPRVGGSAAFRAFLRDELIPAVEARFRTTRERALLGESLAGLFVVETWALEPGLFDSYIAIDPSLWWNREGLTARAAERLKAPLDREPALFIATSSETTIARPVERFAALLAEAQLKTWHHEPMPQETHMTIYHPAALRALRQLFKPGR